MRAYLGLLGVAACSLTSCTRDPAPQVPPPIGPVERAPRDAGARPDVAVPGPSAPPPASMPDAAVPTQPGPAPTPAPPDVPVPATPESRAAAAFFRTDVVHRIEMTVDPELWATFMDDHGSADADLPWHVADFVIDGRPLRQVGFKSFGYGSRLANPEKPNLNLDLNRNVPGQSLDGVTRMRVKNNGQDVTGLRQTITYEALRAANLLAPRSSFAELFVNGTPYGFYFVEESFNKDFVRERTGNDNGAAYEANDCQGFVEPEGGCATLVQRYIRSFNPTVGAGEDLAAICTAMNGPAQSFIAQIAPLIHLPEWIDQVAAHTAIAGDLDGYSTNGNNFRLYRDTATGKMRLVLLGADTTFDPKTLPAPDPLRPVPGRDCDRRSDNYRDIFLEKLLGTPAGAELYRKAVQRLRSGPMSAVTLAQRVDALWAFIGARVLADARRDSAIDPALSKEDIKRYLERRGPQLDRAGL